MPVVLAVFLFSLFISWQVVPPVVEAVVRSVGVCGSRSAIGSVPWLVLLLPGVLFATYVACLVVPRVVGAVVPAVVQAVFTAFGL